MRATKLLLASLLTSLTVSAASAAPCSAAQDAPMVVAASFDAVAEITRAVGGERVCVETLIGPGMEPHDFSPTTGTMRMLSGVKLLIVSGLGLESGWAPRTAATIEVNGKPLTVLEASRGVKPLAAGGGTDPHTWLSPKGAAAMAAEIAQALSGLDPAGASAYEANARAFAAEMSAVGRTLEESAKAHKKPVIVSAHAAFGYVCRDYGFTCLSASSVFSGGSPSPKALAKLSAACREAGVKTIFSENLENSIIARTVAEEVGAATGVLYTMESPEDGLSLTERMRRNAEAIAASLGR